MIKVKLDHTELSYSGRIDKSNPEKPEMIFPASSLSFRFFGKKALVKVRNRNDYWTNYLGVFVDGCQKCFRLQNEGVTEIVLIDEKEDNHHEILLFKRMDSCHEVIFDELELSDGSVLLPAVPKPKRRMEVYGDSVSAGEVSEAVAYTGMPDPEHDGEYSNSWYSYAWITARKLNAELHDIAQGGIALMDGSGWFHGTDYIGMESIWDKLHYNPTFQNEKNWDFSLYTPQVVIVAIGQNDSHPEDYMASEYSGDRGTIWRQRYRIFLEKLQNRYPKAHIICCTTLLEHDSSWDRAIRQVCDEMEDKQIHFFRFQRGGSGTPGHLRIPEAEEMAEELAVFINSLEIEGWD